MTWLYALGAVFAIACIGGFINGLIHIKPDRKGQKDWWDT